MWKPTMKGYHLHIIYYPVHPPELQRSRRELRIQHVAGRHGLGLPQRACQGGRAWWTPDQTAPDR